MQVKVERGPDGRATAVSVALKVGHETRTFSEPVVRGDVEIIARLKAEAAVLSTALDAQAAHAIEVSRPGFPSLKQWFDHWFHHRYMLNVWGRKVGHKGRELDVLKKWRMIPEKYHRISMDSFTPATLNRMVNEIGAMYASTTTATFVDVLHPLFADALRYGWEDGSGKPVPWRAASDPAAFVRRPEPRSKAKPILGVDDACAILEASERRHGGLHWTTRAIAFGVVLGLRSIEIVTLEWRQVTLAPGGDVAGFITWVDERKGGIGLRLPIPHVLLRYLPPLQTEGRVFTRMCLTRARKLINTELRAAAADAGVDVGHLSSHCLRHSFAHAIYKRAGAVTADVSRALGHTSESTTKRYLRGVDDLERITGIVDPIASSVVPQ